MIPKIWWAAAAGAAALASGSAVQAQPQPQCPDGSRPVMLYFPAGSAEVDKESGYPLLGFVFQSAQPNGRISIDGRVDAAEPVALAMARATAIGELFKGAGVSEARLTITSSGASQPAVYTSGPEPLNRVVHMCVSRG